MIKSVYVHIPFCKKICSYCDFCKNYYNEIIVNKYLNTLSSEINDNYRKELLDTLYIGGGTPSALSNQELNKLFIILSVFKLSKNYEFTFECNYEDISVELLEILKNNGVNRLSIGIQTFNDKYSKLLNRNINRDDMINKVVLAKKYFDNINIDLMYGYDGETIDELTCDINDIIALDINHISTYCLILEEHTSLYVNNYKEVSSDIQSEMYKKICDILKENNYDHYEISNFAKNKCYSKHNITYWENKEYYGFGLGASGYINRIRYTNTKSINKYLKKKYVYDCEYINDQVKMKEELMLSLRTKNGLNINDYKSKYNINFLSNNTINDMINKELIILKNERLYISEKNFFISNEIILKLFEVCGIM